MKSNFGFLVIATILLFNFSCTVIAKDAVKFTADHRQLDRRFKNAQEEDWEFQSITFCSSDTVDFIQGIDLVTRKRDIVEPYGQKLKKPIVLFQLDTIFYTEYSHYFYFHANPVYFEQLQIVDAVDAKKGEHKVGVFKQELLKAGIMYRDIPPILITNMVIDTYDHLYAELTVKKEDDNKSFYQVFYHVIWHICTSECFDPEYDFSVKIDKQTREIFVVK